MSDDILGDLGFDDERSQEYKPAALNFRDEGTIAHALATLCFEEGTDAYAYVGRMLESEDYPHSDISPSRIAQRIRCPGSAVLEGQMPFEPRKFSGEVTQDMARDVQVYVDSIREYTQHAAIWFCEVDLDLSYWLGFDDQGKPRSGRGDIILLTWDGELQGHDLKFGKGVRVYANKNEQLLTYWTAAKKWLEENYPDLPKIQRGRVVIHQPRIISRPDEYPFELGEAFEHAAKLHKVAEDVAIAKAHTGDMESFAELFLHAGATQCRWCEAKTSCPKFERDVLSTVAYDGPQYLTMEAPEALEDFAQPADAGWSEAERLAFIGPKLEMIELWVRAVRARIDALERAGEHVPGFKLVQGKKGNRAWVNATAAEAALKALRLKKEDMYTSALKSPPQMEKVLKDKHPRVWAKMLAEHVTRAPGAIHVAREDDPRPAISLVSTADDFEADDDDLATLNRLADQTIAEYAKLPPDMRVTAEYDITLMEQSFLDDPDALI